MRQSIATRVTLVFKDASGDPVTTLVATDFLNSKIYLLKSDGTEEEITVVTSGGGQNLFIPTTSKFPGTRQLAISATNNNTEGDFTVSCVPAASAFIPFSECYFVRATPASPTDVTNARDAIRGSGNPSIADIKAKTDNLPSDPADESQLEAAITTAVASINSNTNSGLAALPSAPSAGVIAAAVWNAARASYEASGSAGEAIKLIKAALINRCEQNGDGSQVTIYADDGITPLRTFAITSTGRNPL